MNIAPGARTGGALQTERGPNPWLQGLQPVQSLQDIQSLIEAEVPEGQHLEYKRELPGGAESWNSDRNLNAAAKKKILQEVVAFANAYGGRLLLGIAESETKPPVAQQIYALPDCADVAERWQLIFRDCVEPPLSPLQIYPVPTRGDEGVVVFQVGRSVMAPHRVTLTKQCPIRRADRCENMTMREIQDMSVNTARGLERLERQLKTRSRLFREQAIHDFQIVEGIPIDRSPHFIGVRLTAAPLVDAVSIHPVFHNKTIVETLAPLKQSVQWNRGAEEGELPPPLWFSNRNWKPMLRATRVDSSPKPTREAYKRKSTSGWPPYHNLYCELHCNGLVELGYVSNTVGPPNVRPEVKLPECWLLSWIPNLLVWADQVRCQAQAPMAEYVLEVEVIVEHLSCALVAGLESPEWPDSKLSYPPTTVSIEPQTQIFPHYPFHHINEIDDFISWFRRDLWNWLGQDISDDESFSLVNMKTVA